MFVTLTLNPAIDQTILVEGELTLNGLHSVTQDTRTPGGKGVNVAKVLATHGQAVIVAGLIGEDSRHFFETTLQPAGMICRFLSLPHPTRINFMISDRHGHEMKFNRPGFPDLPFKHEEFFPYIQSLTTPGDVVIMSGSLPARFPTDTYASLITLFRQAGCSTVVDTSGPALKAALETSPDLIKPNRHELEALLGQSLETEGAMQKALTQLMKNREAIIVSDGARGAWFAGKGRIWFAAAPTVKCIDTTGAGDTLLGQFCADYFPERKITPEIMARSVAAGAASVEQCGTPIIAPKRIIELAGQVRPRLYS